MNDYSHLPALLVIDMQVYYMDQGTSYFDYFEGISPGSLSYIHSRCHDVVVPVVNRLTDLFSRHSLPVIFVKLCSNVEDRSDLHPLFRETFNKGLEKGFSQVYPLCSSVEADIHPSLEVPQSSYIVEKGTFSGFTKPHLENLLNELGVTSLFITGLATSQCVETTARDGSERGFEIFNIEDGQADYSESVHRMSHAASQGVCGSPIHSSEVINLFTLP
jgi:nicotinamidase-related amidase